MFVGTDLSSPAAMADGRIIGHTGSATLTRVGARRGIVGSKNHHFRYA